MHPMNRRTYILQFDCLACTYRQNRLFFTSWLVTVQVVTMIVTLAVYGLAPVGFEFEEEQTQVISYAA